MNFIYGINAVSEALKSQGRAFQWVGVAKERNDLRLQKLIQECRKNSIAVRFLPRVELDRMAGSGSHQGRSSRRLREAVHDAVVADHARVPRQLAVRTKVDPGAVVRSLSSFMNTTAGIVWVGQQLKFGRRFERCAFKAS